VSSRERRAADLFFADLMGNPVKRARRQSGAPPRWTPSDASEPEAFDGEAHENVDAESAVLGAAPHEIWEVVAFPGSATPLADLRAGDLAISHARDAGRLAQLRVVGEDIAPGALYGSDGRFRRDTLALRRRARAQRDDGYEAPIDDQPDAVQRARAWSTSYDDEQAPSTTTDLGDVTIGAAQINIRVAGADEERRPSFEEALQLALGRTGRCFALRGPLYAPGETRVCGFTPPAAPAGPLPPVIDCVARATDLCALVIPVGGDVAAYFPSSRANLGTPGTAAQLRRWVVIPKLRDFYGLPAAVQREHRRLWIDALARVTGLGFTRAALDALPTPALRLLLAQNGAAAFPVEPISRGNPPRDRGGVVNGVTFPLPAFPLVEPDCYLPVISRPEGRLESVNAWDAGAGISVGPIQINLNPAEGTNEQTLFRVLWRVSIDDRALFDQEFSALGWRMRFDPAAPTPSNNDAFVLTVSATGGTTVDLRSVAADMDRNVRYFQTGVAGQAGFVPAFRRDLAGRFRNVVVWPHVQQTILDVSSSWLRPGLARINAQGIPALDPNNPDRDTFTLRAVLMSAYVRFSGCLLPLMQALRRWTTAADKIAHIPDALATLSGDCPSLADRLHAQVATARSIFTGLDAIRQARTGGGGGREAYDEALVEAADEGIGEAYDVVAAEIASEAFGESFQEDGEPHTGEGWDEGWQASEEPAGEAVLDEGCRIEVAESSVDTSETAPTDDDVVRALDRIRGTSVGTFAAYRASLVDGTVFGCSVQGVHREFLSKLQKAEAAAVKAIGGTGTPTWRITTATGFRPAAGKHTWGLAVDLNYASSPYVMHERGEAALDTQLAPVYDRIARWMLGRAGSVIPRDITQGAKSAERTTRLYTALAEESAAMVQYFSCLATPEKIKQLLIARPLTVDGARAFFGDQTAATPENVLRRIITDYVILTGRAGPIIPDETYPTVEPVRIEGNKVADRPFAGDAARRDPQLGFLSIRPEIVEALSKQGLRWGAIDFGPESGDVMHFDDGNGTLAQQIESARAAARG
jgi:hypothetical protein